MGGGQPPPIPCPAQAIATCARRQSFEGSGSGAPDSFEAQNRIMARPCGPAAVRRTTATTFIQTFVPAETPPNSHTAPSLLTSGGVPNPRVKQDTRTTRGFEGGVGLGRPWATNATSIDESTDEGPRC